MHRCARQDSGPVGGLRRVSTRHREAKDGDIGGLRAREIRTRRVLQLPVALVKAPAVLRIGHACGGTELHLGRRVASDADVEIPQGRNFDGERHRNVALFTHAREERRGEGLAILGFHVAHPAVRNVPGHAGRILRPNWVPRSVCDPGNVGHHEVRACRANERTHGPQESTCRKLPEREPSHRIAADNLVDRDARIPRALRVGIPQESEDLGVPGRERARQVDWRGGREIRDGQDASRDGREDVVVKGAREPEGGIPRMPRKLEVSVKLRVDIDKSGPGRGGRHSAVRLADSRRPFPIDNATGVRSSQRDVREDTGPDGSDKGPLRQVADRGGQEQIGRGVDITNAECVDKRAVAFDTKVGGQVVASCKGQSEGVSRCIAADEFIGGRVSQPLCVIRAAIKIDRETRDGARAGRQRVALCEADGHGSCRHRKLEGRVAERLVGNHLVWAVRCRVREQVGIREVGPLGHDASAPLGRDDRLEQKVTNRVPRAFRGHLCYDRFRQLGHLQYVNVHRIRVQLDSSSVLFDGEGVPGGTAQVDEEVECRVLQLAHVGR